MGRRPEDPLVHHSLSSLLALEFASITFDHCSREANSVADDLAKHCISSGKSEAWETVIPDFILHHYVNDLAII